MAEHSVICGVCGGTLIAASEHELVKTFRDHAKHQHDMDVPEEMARQKVKEAAEGKA